MAASYNSNSFEMDLEDADGYQSQFGDDDGGLVVRSFLGTSGAIDVQRPSKRPKRWVTPISVIGSDTIIPNLQALAAEQPPVARTLTDSRGNTYSNVYIARVFNVKRQAFATNWTASVEWVKAG